MKNRAYAYPIAAVSGLLTGLCVSYFIPAALQWASMVPFITVLFRHSRADAEKTVRRGLLLGLSYFYPYYLTVWYWFLTMYPLDFTGLSPAAALVAILFAWLGLPLLQAVFAMWQVPLYIRASKSRFISGGRAYLLMPILFALIYIIFEWAQTLTWAGVPWGRLAIGQAYTPVFVQTASLFGSYFVSLVIVLVNGYIASAIISWRGVRVRSVVSVVLASVVFFLNLFGGAVINAVRVPDEEDRCVTVGIVQGNISSKDKWSDHSLGNLTNVYGRLTSAAAEDGVDIVLWTETSLPYVLNDYSTARRFIETTSKLNDITLLATAFWREEVDGERKEYNAVMTVTPGDGIDTENVYAKRKLVPFGEFVPFEELVRTLVPPLASLAMFQSRLSFGEDAVVQKTEYGKIGALVCFDSIYEECSLDAVRGGAELLTISTNDSWFGDSAALYQHTAQAVLRAVETDRYVARAGNTGYSCFITPSGRIMSSLPINEEGHLLGEVYMRDTITLYSVIGNSVVLLAGIAVAVVLAESVIYNKMKRKESERK